MQTTASMGITLEVLKCQCSQQLSMVIHAWPQCRKNIALLSPFERGLFIAHMPAAINMGVMDTYSNACVRLV